MRKAVWCAVVASVAVTGSAHAWTEGPYCTLQAPASTTFESNTCDETRRPVRASEPWVEPISVEQARWAFDQAERLLEQGRADDAVLNLRVVERAMPALKDRLALRRAEALAKVGMLTEACRAYEDAAKSEHRDVAVRGRVGAVACLLDLGDRKAEDRLNSLLRRYPLLDARDALRLKLAGARERWGQAQRAVAILQGIDLHAPASSEAAQARAQLRRLQAQGVTVPPYRPAQRVDRAETMLRTAPTEMLVAELAVLRDDRRLTAELRARVHVLAAQLARRQGDWDAVRREIEDARRNGATGPELVKLLPPTPPVPAEEAAADQARDDKAIDARLRALVRNRPLRKLTNTQLRYLIDAALRYGRVDIANEALENMAARSKFPPAVRFNTAIDAMGVASDDVVAKLLATLLDVRRFAVPAGYHYARALERAGRLGEAEAQYLDVLDRDHSRTRYYAMWAAQRLWSIQSERVQSCAPRAPGSAPSVTPPIPPAIQAVDVLFERDALAEEDAVTTYRIEDEPEPVLASTGPAAGQAPSEQAAQSMQQSWQEQLGVLARDHGEAFPWIVRARDLVRLGLMTEAADELHEAYLVWREARGAARLRAGLEAVLTGNAPPRHAADWRLRRERASLDAAARQSLAAVARELGDPATALGFGGWRQGTRPRAYTEAVQQAAEKYDIDPNLLFAVMRVESIYNRRIVSYAGAVGLMQIMPNTGRRIAQTLGVEDFAVSDLLDPETNVEFSAWYLSSLIKRFDGKLPLAIASYNGGPQNVRLWLRRSNPHMPLDAFLETIPFTQTHRYVRRVLTHYAAYRAQQDLPMTRLPLDLPDPHPDKIAF